MFNLKPPMTGKYTITEGGDGYRICRVVAEHFKTKEEAVEEMMYIMKKECEEAKEAERKKKIE